MVVDAAPGSTVPRRQLGRYLRDARGRARMTVRAAADALEWSEAKIWRIETGQTSMRSHDVEAMCRVYGATATLTEALVGLAKQTKEKGWWHAYGDVIPAWFDLYIGVQEAAAELRQYQSELVPGLLQTAEYARAVITADNPGVGPAEIDDRVELRMQRQSLLTRPVDPPACTFLLDEAIVRRPVGGRRALADQLRRLAELTDLPNVTVRIVPFRTGLHHGIIAGAFTLLRFPLTADGRETEPAVVYIENLAGALYLEKPAEVELYESAFDRVWRMVDQQTDLDTRDALWATIRGLDR